VTALSAWLEEEIASGSFPGASALLAGVDGIEQVATAGNAAVEPAVVAVSDDTLWDLASLTKPLCCGALARVATDGGLDLDRPPGAFFPAWKKTRYDGITLRTLLTHTSGLPAWYPLYARGEGARQYAKTPATSSRPTSGRRSTRRLPISSRRRPDRRRGSFLRMPGPRRRPKRGTRRSAE
jgi:CubicO group peptidase (beta-lactamase class C family)